MSHEQENDLSDDYIDLTDTSTSSSSSNNAIFETNQPLVLELHDIKRDEPNVPTTEGPENPEAAVPARRRRKRRKNALGEEESVSSASGSEADSASLVPSANAAVEEFYDAHESYHAMPENQRSAPIETGLVLASSEHAALKEIATAKIGSSSATHTHSQLSTAQRQTSTAQRQQSTISKPVDPPSPQAPE